MTRSPSAPSASSSPAAGPPVLRLRTPEEVFAAVPYLLGFRPRRSLVVLGLHGPRGRLGVSMRMDLDGPPEQMAEVVVRSLRSDGDTSAIVVLYDPADRRPEGTSALPTDALVDAVERGCRKASITVRDVLCVADGRWWSLRCQDLDCCPAEGKPLDTPSGTERDSLVDVTAVSAGMTALPDRQALRATLEPPAPWTYAATDQAMDRFADTLVRRLEHGEQEQVEDELLTLLETLVLRFGGRNPSIADTEAAEVALGLQLLEVRDTVITWTLRDDAEALQRLLVETVRRVRAPEHVPAATVLSWCAYSRGNGGLASVALELVNESEPEYSLARLMDHTLQHGLHPDLLRTTTRRTGQEMAQRRRRRDAGRDAAQRRSRPAVPEEETLDGRAG